ncbi:MAG: TolC family protein [Proteobacteria bacterium]|nr:TolC family protein [Pseudomonadota bacterium]MBU2260448.1 TolC family protein [Pseudomonadota bacterium]
MIRKAVFIGFILTVFPALVGAASALTLEEALIQAREKLPSYQAVKKKLESVDALYGASLGPYLPSLDASAGRQRHEGGRSDYSSTGYDVTLSYRLFDPKRGVLRDIAGLNLETEREELRKSLLELDYRVKIAFYTALAGREILEQRKVQLEDARKDHEVAEGRRSLGVARLSEVLQASVRFEQARYNVVQAEGNLQKALAELFSLIGRPEETAERVEGRLEAGGAAPDLTALSEAILKRPEIVQAEIGMKKAENSQSLALGDFYPIVSANLSYSRSDAATLGGRASEDRSAAIGASWNLFELGKFYRAKSTRIEMAVSEENLRELKRQLLLECRKAYEDLTTAVRNETVAAQQLRRAEQNYEQAFGEYKVGKGDILSLVQAESLLAGAREQLTSARLNAVLARALLERVAGIGK